MYTPWGEVLFSRALVRSSSLGYVRSAAYFEWPIPFDISLCGLELHVQGLCSQMPWSAGKLAYFRSRLSNALDLVVGL